MPYLQGHYGRHRTQDTTTDFIDIPIGNLSHITVGPFSDKQLAKRGILELTRQSGQPGTEINVTASPFQAMR